MCLANIYPLHRFYHHSIRPSKPSFSETAAPWEGPSRGSDDDVQRTHTVIPLELSGWSWLRRDSHRCDVEAVRTSWRKGDAYMETCIKHVWICGWFNMKTQTFWSFGSINPGLIFLMIFQCRCFCRTVNRGLAYHECRVGPWCRGVSAALRLK